MAWDGLEINRLTTTTGAVWDFNDATCGVTIASVVGLDVPPIQAWTDEAVHVHGQRFRGYRYEARKVAIVTHVVGDAGASWAALDHALMAGMDPGGVCTWTVKAPGAVAKTLTLRPQPQPGEAVELEPVHAGYIKRTLDFVADQPFWARPPVTASAAPKSMQSFWPTTERPGSFFFSSGSGEATFVNSGQVAVFPVFTVDGPVAAGGKLSIDIGGAPTSITYPIPAGQSFSIDFRPDSPIAQGIYLNDAAHTRLTGLPGVEFTPVPIAPGATTTAAVTIPSGSSVTYTLTPLDLVPW